MSKKNSGQLEGKNTNMMCTDELSHLQSPMLRETININVDGLNQKVYRDEITKKINESLSVSLARQNGKR